MAVKSVDQVQTDSLPWEEDKIKMLRPEFLEKLETIAPAISDNDMVPIMTHVWFTGTTMMAYNDQIAIAVECVTDFAGAVPSTIIDIIKASRSKTVELIKKDNYLHIKMANNSNLRLPLKSKSEFIFDMPKLIDPENAISGKIKSLLNGIDSCMKSVSKDTNIIDQLGVTMISDGQSLDLFSTDDTSICHTNVKVTTKKFRAILSAPFCRQLLTFAKRTKDHKLEVTDDYALLVTDKVILYGGLIETDEPVDFYEKLDAHITDKIRKKLIPIDPKELRRLQLVLERASIIADKNKGVTTITIRNGTMKFKSATATGEVDDVIEVPDHPDITVRLEAVHLKLGCERLEKLLVTETCGIMIDGPNLFVVAATDG